MNTDNEVAFLHWLIRNANGYDLYLFSDKGKVDSGNALTEFVVCRHGDSQERRLRVRVDHCVMDGSLNQSALSAFYNAVTDLWAEDSELSEATVLIEF